MLLLILLGLLLSGATTALLGAGTFLGALLVVPLLGKWGRPGSSITGRERLLVVGLIVLGMVVVLSPLVAGASGEGQMASHTRKLLAQDDGGSGYVRWQTMRVGLRVFARSPLLGVGYGSHRTSALATSLLSNLGVVGTCAFLAFNAVVFSHALGVYRSSRDPALATAAFAGLLCYCTVFPVLVFAQSMVSIAFGWYWFLMAMLEATWLASQEDQADGLPACVGSGPAPQTAREARR